MPSLIQRLQAKFTYAGANSADNLFRELRIITNMIFDQEYAHAEKLVWIAMFMFQTEDGCTLSDSQLMEFCNLSRSAVQNAIKKLKKTGRIQHISFDGRMRKVMATLGHPTKHEKLSRRLLRGETYE